MKPTHKESVAMTLRTFNFFTAILISGCTGTVGQPLPSGDEGDLMAFADSPETLGQLIYEGRVQPRGDDDDAVFQYDRRVAQTDDGWIATHLTRTTAGEPVVLHRTVYTDDNTLVSFDEIHAQTGLTGHVELQPDGSLELDVSLGEQQWHRTEGAGDPVHAGPSLYGFALNHWDDLLDGEKVPLRFIVLADQRTYRFVLRLESTDADATVFRMTAASAFVRMAVPVMDLTFDTATRDVLRYEGPVPPMSGDDTNLAKLDGRVDYVHIADTYR
jgi:hypothetical protein